MGQPIDQGSRRTSPVADNKDLNFPKAIEADMKDQINNVLDGPKGVDLAKVAAAAEAFGKTGKLTPDQAQTANKYSAAITEALDLCRSNRVTIHWLGANNKGLEVGFKKEQLNPEKISSGIIEGTLKVPKTDAGVLFTYNKNSGDLTIGYGKQTIQDGAITTEHQQKIEKLSDLGPAVEKVIEMDRDNYRQKANQGAADAHHRKAGTRVY